MATANTKLPATRERLQRMKSVLKEFFPVAE